MKNTCTYIIAEPPQTPWWGHGIPVMPGNTAMELHFGEIPDNAALRNELNQCLSYYREASLFVVQIPFSPYLDALYKHDGIFCTDAGVTTVNGNDKPRSFISNFSASYRQEESESIRRLFDLQGIEVLIPPSAAKIEGGETHYTPFDHFYFGGLNRANKKGHHFIISNSRVNDAILLKTDGFHLDTVLSPVLDVRGALKYVLACRAAMTRMSWNALHRFCRKHDIDLLELDESDSIGSKQCDYKDATYAVNCMPTPGLLIGNNYFQTEGVEEKLQEKGIEHHVIPLNECAKVAGAFHCLTQQCPMHDSTEVIRWYMQGEVAALYRLLKNPALHKLDADVLIKQLPLMSFDEYELYGIQKQEITDLKQARDSFLSSFSPSLS